MSSIIVTRTGGSGSGDAGFRLGTGTSTFDAATKTAAETARDAYFTANPSVLTQYENNPALNTLLLYTNADGNRVGEFYTYDSDNDAWVINASYVGVPGKDGAGTDFGAISDNHIPAIGPGGVPYDSGIDVSGELLVTPKDIQVGLGTILLGQKGTPVHAISSAGEQIVFGNRSSNIPYTPAGWCSGEAGGDWIAYFRSPGELHENDVVASIDTDELVNPVWSFTLPSNRRDYNLMFKVVEPQTNCYVVVKQNDHAIFQSKYIDVVAGENNFSFSLSTGNQGFLDLVGGVEYTMEAHSLDGDIKLLGVESTTTPYLKLTWQEWTDVPIITTDNLQEKVAETNTLVNPTWVARDTGDTDIVYGAFKDSGIIRKRVVSTGVDTYFRSSASTPITDITAWTDWTNRESLTYGAL